MASSAAIQYLPAAATFMGSLASGISAKRQADYTASMFDANAAIARMQEADALARGEVMENRSRIATRKAIGASRAALASQGIDVNEGSPVDVQSDLAGIGELDALTIRNNAAREAWGYSIQSMNYGMQSNLYSMAGSTKLRDSLLTGSVSALKQFPAIDWSRYQSGVTASGHAQNLSYAPGAFPGE